MLNSEVPYVRYLDRSDREDVRLHQPRCHNASAYGLRGYVDNTLPSRCYAITMILRVRRNFFEITTIPQQPQLPNPDDQFQILEQILDQRVVRRGSGSLVQVLVKWSATPIDMATWEDKVTLQQKFPRAPAWGQAVSKEGGIVSEPVVGQKLADEACRPRRQPRLPARLAGPEWA